MSRPRPPKKRRKPAARSKAPVLAPAARLEGWSFETLADEAGIDRVQAYRVLERGVREGSIVRLECGTQTLYARLGGGAITQTPAPRH